MSRRRPPSRANDGRRAATPDDELFRRTMTGVDPLKKRPKLSPATGDDIETAKPRPGRKPPPVRPAPQTPAGAAEPPLSASQFAGIDRRTVERMRRGKLPIDARLDLHGMYQDAAQAELNAFIARCAGAGCRTVLVITGKGSLREGGGVLRRRLPDWLNQPACRPHVLAFAAARPEHGGSGAFYVLLRRRRDQN